MKPWGRRRAAVPDQKDFREGKLRGNAFPNEASAAAELERNLRLNESVIAICSCARLIASRPTTS